MENETRERRLKKTILITFVIAAANLPFIFVAMRATVPPAVAEQRMAELWMEPSNTAPADLFNGPWGAQYAPDPAATYAFVKPKTHGASPGMTVRDPRGMEWSVKQGAEGPIEVTVSRILSAIGYHQPPVYYLPSFALNRGAPRPGSGQAGVVQTDGGRFRPTIETLREVGDWSWQQNPFVGTKPYQGLLVVLLMLNSSDLKDSNNTFYDLSSPREGASQWFVVRDVGSALGETGRLDPKRNDPDLFDRLRFIRGMKNGFVEFSYHGWHGELIQDRITPDDVRWACERLARLSDTEWSDAFRAGGFDEQIAARYVRRIKAKIDEGQRLAPRPTTNN